MAGIRLSAGAAIFAALIMALIAFALTCIGLTIAWKIESTQGFHAIMNLILIPVLGRYGFGPARVLYKIRNHERQAIAWLGAAFP